MTFHDLRVLVHPGDGIAACFGGAIFVCLPSAASHHHAAGELLLAVERASTEGPQPGRAIAQAIADVLGRTPPPDVPPFAVLSPAEDGVAVLLQGAIDLGVEQAGGRNVLSGRDAMTWVDRVIRGSFDRLEVRPAAGDAGPADPRSRLELGVVPAGGITIVPSGVAATFVSAPAATAAPGPAATPPAPAATAAAPVAPPGPAVAPAPVAPSPVAPSPIAPSPVAPSPVAPPAPTPAAAPVAPPPGPPPTPAPPPPPPQRVSLGALVGDDGSRIELDDNYILGREPFEHPDVTGGTARPFLFLDTEAEISRAHTRVEVRDGVVLLTDLQSANGTYIAVPGATQWQGLAPHTPTPIGPGCRILIGQRTFIYHG